MSFLKNFFNDDGMIIGLCGFNMTKPDYNKTDVILDRLFSTCDNKSFQTDFSKNFYLSV